MRKSHVIYSKDLHVNVSQLINRQKKMLCENYGTEIKDEKKIMHDLINSDFHLCFAPISSVGHSNKDPRKKSGRIFFQLVYIFSGFLYNNWGLPLRIHFVHKRDV